jgi:enamine deaminase RidA (YjgF/YER057c/UK114 family)
MSDRKRHIATDLFPPPGYAHAVTTDGGRVVHCAGACPIDEEGRVVDGGVAVQTLQCLANLRSQLAAAGTVFDDVVQTRIYVATMTREDLLQAWRVVEETPVGASACTLLGVSVLGYDRQLVEIEVVAVVGPASGLLG